MKSQYLVSCAMAAMIGGAAHAASEAPVSDATQSEAAQSVPGDIIVTATRRNESIQKVPLTIQAFAG